MIRVCSLCRQRLLHRVIAHIYRWRTRHPVLTVTYRLVNWHRWRSWTDSVAMQWDLRRVMLLISSCLNLRTSVNLVPSPPYELSSAPTRWRCTSDLFKDYRPLLLSNGVVDGDWMQIMDITNTASSFSTTRRAPGSTVPSDTRGATKKTFWPNTSWFQPYIAPWIAQVCLFDSTCFLLSIFL